jgi:hypothetical protein
MPAAELLLVPAALGLSWAAAVGAASMGAGIFDRAFGWRHLLPPVAALAMLVVVAPVVTSSIDGRWGRCSGESMLTVMDASRCRPPRALRGLRVRVMVPIGSGARPDSSVVGLHRSWEIGRPTSPYLAQMILKYRFNSPVSPARNL